MVLVDTLDELTGVDLAAAQLPVHLRGRVEQNDGSTALDLAVALNGVVRATTRTYPQGNRWQFTALVPTAALVAGDNRVEILRLSGAEDSPEVQRLRQRNGRTSADDGPER
jgi:hypothetical protein